MFKNRIKSKYIYTNRTFKIIQYIVHSSESEIDSINMKLDKPLRARSENSYFHNLHV